MNSCLCQGYFEGEQFSSNTYYLWISYHFWRCKYQEQETRAWMSNYIPHIQWSVIIYRCFWYLLPALMSIYWSSIIMSFVIIIMLHHWNANVILMKSSSLVARKVVILTTCGGAQSFWWNSHHWLHRKLSKWQLPVQPMMKISSKWPRNGIITNITWTVPYYTLLF